MIRAVPRGQSAPCRRGRVGARSRNASSVNPTSAVFCETTQKTGEVGLTPPPHRARPPGQRKEGPIVPIVLYLSADQADFDTDGEGDECDPDDDDDGIVDEIDTQSLAFSNEYWLDAATFGSIARNGWTVSTTLPAPLPGEPQEVQLSVSGAGSGPARISACDGAAKEMLLDSDGESVDWHCEGDTVTVRALTTTAGIQVEKLYCLDDVCNWKLKGDLDAGDTLSTGSPWTAGPDSTIPVTFLDGAGEVIGSFVLDPGDSLEVTILADGGQEYVALDALHGVVTVTVFGRTATLSEGSAPIAFSPDTEPPVLTLPADVTVEAQNSSGAVVRYDASATDTIDGTVTVICSYPTGSVFPLGTTVVTCSARTGVAIPRGGASTSPSSTRRHPRLSARR
ncbi:MAG: HYR domain-containing protein [Acidobacteria bacterium]|nr:HYR domain-containing protein [Acidobacteriota bacterium]